MVSRSTFPIALFLAAFWACVPVVQGQQQVACDFTTGSGWFTPRLGTRADFGLAVGVKNGALWGHLNYAESEGGMGVGLKVKAQTITHYLGTTPNTRVIEGSADTNFFGVRRYKVTVTDNGSPGRNDVFRFELDNGYMTQGDLGATAPGDGDIRIEEGNASSVPPPGSSCQSFGTGDVTPPTVSITSPANGATVSGTVTVSADSSDNVGVVGVQFKLDGANLGPEDTTSPYSIFWDTTKTTNGGHTLTGVARDAAGNTASSSAVAVTVSNAAPAPPGTFKRFEETDPAVIYSGTWFNNTSTLHSGGSARLAVDAGSRATFSFNGIGVRWIGYRDQWSGIARVFLDGTVVQTVDTFSSTNQAQVVLFSATGLSAGIHTLAIEVTGTRSAASSDVWIWVDAFEVESGAAPPADPTPPTVTITSPANGSTVSGTTTVSADASDNVGVVGVRFKLDGADLGAEDTTAPYSVPWDTTTTTNGIHTLTAVARDAAGNTTTSSPVTVTVSNGFARVEQGDPSVIYTGRWFNHTSPAHSGGSARLSMDMGARASFSFGGVGVRWIGYRDQWSGIASVFLNGTLVQNVDTFSAVPKAQTVLFSASGLPSGTHTLAIEVTGTRNATSRGTWIWLDAFDVEGLSTDTVPPSVSITSPANGSTVSGTITVSANASDNRGVVGVQFKLDGANLGAEDPTAPYSISWNTTSTTNGSHTLTAMARDAAGNTTMSAPVTVTVSNAAPTPSTTFTRFEQNDPAVIYTGTWFNNTSTLHSGGSARMAMDAGSRAAFSFSGVGVRWIGYKDEWAGIANVFLDGTLVQTVDTFASPVQAQKVIFAVSGLPSGNHTLVVEATGTRSTSSAGEWIWVDAFEVETTTAPPSDTTPPTVAITSPVSGSTVSGTITVSANASDNVGVAQVQFMLDGTTSLGVDTTAPYSVSWNTTTATNGSHTLTAIATDTSGNSTTSSPVTVTVNNDTTPPTVAITSPAGGSTVSGTITVSASASDNVGVAQVQFMLDGTTSLGVDTTAPYSVSWNTTTAANGSHTLTAIATDTSGNSATSSPVTVTVNNPPPADTTPPIVAITSPASGATVSGTVTVSADASDNVGVAQVQFMLDGMTSLGVDTTAPYSVSWDTTTATDGSHTLTAIATDTSGNTATSSPVTVTVSNAPAGDTTPPTVAITSPANGSTVSGTITVSASASDNVGVAQVQFMLDGTTSLGVDTTAPYSVSWNTTTATNGSHTLTAIATDTSGNSTTSSPVTVTVNNPAPTPTGEIFLSFINGNVERRSSTGSLLQTLPSQVGNAQGWGMAFDAAGNLYVSHFENLEGTHVGTVATWDANGNFLGRFGETCTTATAQTPFPPSCYFANPGSIVFNSAGQAYVGQADGTRDILQFDAAGNLLARFNVAEPQPVPPGRGSNFIGLASDQCTIRYTGRTQTVFQFNVCTNAQLPNFNAAPLPGDAAYTLRILPDGGVLVANAAVIVRLDAAGNQVQTYDDPAQPNIWIGLDLTGDGTFWASSPPVAGQTSSSVCQFDLATGSLLTCFPVPGTVDGVEVR